MSDVLGTLHSAYSFIRGAEANKAAGAFTLDHAIQQQIDMLQKDSKRPIEDSKGQVTGTRVSRWDQLDVLEKEIDLVIQAIEAAGTDSEELASIGLIGTGGE